jgi:hypothetical protein
VLVPLLLLLVDGGRKVEAKGHPSLPGVPGVVKSRSKAHAFSNSYIVSA